jgi:RNA polymerase sigma-70 factor (ECF subfamily)
MKQELLVELIYKKDEEAFTVLYDMYAKSLFGIISNYCRNNELAEKLLAEVFSQLWNTIDSYSEKEGRLYTWIVFQTREYIEEYLKSNALYNPIKLHSENFVQLLDDENKPETIGIQEYVRKLRPKSIKIVDSLFFKGQSLESVADSFEITPQVLQDENRNSINEIRNFLGA